jgi:outer membrane murein-binding lipoprotein Lpp
MTVALAAALAVVAAALVVVAVQLAGGRRRVSVEVGRERARADENAGRVKVLEDAAARVEERLRAVREEAEATRRRAEVAERRAEEAERRAHGAERRAESAEKRAEKRAEEAQRRAAAASEADGPDGPGGSIWDLERLRVEREWADVVGPGEDLPVAWDGTLGAAVATELAIIREVIGTPSELDTGSPVIISDPLQGALIVRLCAELLRTLGRSGDHMSVRVTRQNVIVDQPADSQPPDTDRLSRAARRAGAELNVTSDAEKLRVQLRLPGAGANT